MCIVCTLSTVLTVPANYMRWTQYENISVEPHEPKVTVSMYVDDDIEADCELSVSARSVDGGRGKREGRKEGRKERNEETEERVIDDAQLECTLLSSWESTPQYLLILPCNLFNVLHHSSTTSQRPSHTHSSHTSHHTHNPPAIPSETRSHSSYCHRTFIVPPMYRSRPCIIHHPSIHIHSLSHRCLLYVR